MSVVLSMLSTAAALMHAVGMTKHGALKVLQSKADPTG
jgi:hypothetical protein